MKEEGKGELFRMWVCCFRGHSQRMRVQIFLNIVLLGMRVCLDGI